jgi:microcystin-dependent protein
MTPIEPAVFNNANVVLRIWFDDGVNGEQQLKPDQPLVSAPYTMESERVGGWLAKELVPPGTIVAFGGASAPPGWLLCDGSEIPRAAYAGLFDAVGTNWGGGDGIATFHLPDLRGRFLRGRDGGSGRDPDVESRTPANIVGSSGDAVGSVQGDAFQGHRHGLNHSNLSATEWNGGNNGFVDWTPGNTTTHRFWNDWRVMGALTDPSYGTVRITSETRPINAYVNYIIKY